MRKVLIMLGIIFLVLIFSLILKYIGNKFFYEYITDIQFLRGWFSCIFYFYLTQKFNVWE